MIINPGVSIVIPCRDEGHYVQQTIRQILHTPGEIPYEIIVVDDGSRDGCCNFLRRGGHPPSPVTSSGFRVPSRKNPQLATRNPELMVHVDKAGGPAIHLLSTSGAGAARARNLGAAAARAPYLVFCDAHVIVSPGWLEGLIGCLEKGEADAVCPAIELARPPGYTFYGGTWNENLSWVGLVSRPAGVQEIPLAPAGCLAVRADVFRSVGGFEEGFRIWGCDDAEFSLKLWLFGFRVAVYPLVRILHLTRPAPAYQLRGEHLVFNLLLLALLHFSGPRLAKTVILAENFPGFTPALSTQLFLTNQARRCVYMRRRVFSDDWFMQRFKIPF